MKTIAVVALSVITLSGCTAVERLRSNPYENPFYQRYLSNTDPVDIRIQQLIDTLEANPRSVTAHNELGQLLVQKGFPKDAAREFERAINADSRFFPAWYNLGLIRAANEDPSGARRALLRTVSLKPGHAPALFQLGLMEEKRRNTERAVAYYAKAFAINPTLLDVKVNPRILDSRITHLALLRMYPAQHTRQSLQFQPTGAYVDRPLEAPSPEAKGREIVTPSAPPTDPGTQTAPPQPNP